MAVIENTLTRARVDLAAAFRACAHYGFNEGIDNHLSLAVPGSDELFLLNPWGPHWSELTAGDLLTLDLDARVVEGDGVAETTAFQIHRGVHQARPTARCVFHTHMPYATAVSLIPGGFETRASQNSALFHGQVATLDYGGLADGESEGRRIGAAVGEHARVVVLRNHGVLVIGETVAEAWRDLYFLERACEVQILAQSTGQPIALMPEDVAAHTNAQWRKASDHADLTFAAIKRELDRATPGYDV